MDPLGLSGCPGVKDDRRKRHHSSSAVYKKHTQARTKEQAEILSSNGGTAQYWDESLLPNATSQEVTAFRNSTEKLALRDSIEVNLGNNKGSSYYIQDMKRTIGYNNGKSTQYLRVEVTNTSTPEFHGYPISKDDYSNYMRLKK